VKVEHAISLAVLAILFGGFNFIIGILVQFGYGDMVNNFMVWYSRLCASVPFYVWLLIVGFGLITLLMVGGKGE
jgi:ABC-type amino acid transport system permease subunit